MPGKTLRCQEELCYPSLNSVTVVEAATDAGEQEIEADCKTPFELDSC